MVHTKQRYSGVVSRNKYITIVVIRVSNYHLAWNKYRNAIYNFRNTKYIEIDISSTNCIHYFIIRWNTFNCFLYNFSFLSPTVSFLDLKMFFIFYVYISIILHVCCEFNIIDRFF